MEGAAAREQMYFELSRSLPAQLPAFLRRKRWFGGKARAIRSTEIFDLISVNAIDVEGVIVITHVNYGDGLDDLYAIPLTFAGAENDSNDGETDALTVGNSETGRRLVLRDGLQDSRLLRFLLHMIERELVLRGKQGQLRASKTRQFERYCTPSALALEPKPVGTEQSNSSIVYGERLILKFFRRLEAGANPDLELGLFLTEKANFPHIPQVAGALEYHLEDGRRMTQGILQAFVPNVSDAWRYTVSCVSDFYESLLAAPLDCDFSKEKQVRRIHRDELPARARHSLDEYLGSAGLLGKRTAQLHLALASHGDDPAFAPEPFDDAVQRGLRDSFRAMTTKVLSTLREKAGDLPPEARKDAQRLVRSERELNHRSDAALERPIEAMRIRIHGDYHLGQILYTGTDFVIIDFEGEPARSLEERRMKRSPLQDVAGMLRSFQYAAFAPLLGAARERPALHGGMTQLGGWADLWNSRVAERFLADYFRESRQAIYLPRDGEQLRTLLEFHLLEKAIYELGYELNNRPDWVAIPLAGILSLLPSESPDGQS